MLDFLEFELVPEDRRYKIPTGYKIVPAFMIRRSKHLIVKDKNFCAIWDEENKEWSKDYYRAIELIDQELFNYYNNIKHDTNISYVAYLRDSSSGSIDKWLSYMRKLPN